MSVVRNPHALPRITRPGAGIVKASAWDVGTPERQRAAVDAIAAAWGKRDWPDEHLLSYSVYIGNDGGTLFHYSQWADEESYRIWLTGARSDTVAEIDAAVPGIERLWLHTYELYRNRGGSAGDAGRVPGAIIVVDIEFDGPDPVRQRAWVDGVFEALESDPEPAPGGISGHFHVSVDGTRVLNYAEWESAQAHIDALAEGEGIGSATSEWHRVQSFPGVTGLGMKRYTPALSLSGGVAGA